MSLKFWALSAAFMFAGAASAVAHTAYLMPRDFTPSGTVATIDGAFATTFFTPEIGLSSPTMHAVKPAGGDTTFDSMAVDATHGQYDLGTVDEGTYRVTTGEILGPVTTMVGVDGAWRPLGAGETPPEDAQTQTLQTVTVAEAYVTKVRPTNTAFATPTGRLAIQPITHPNRISVATGFEVQLLFDGQPMPNMAIVLYGEGDPETKLDRFVTTGADGHATFTFTAPGKYLAAVRYRANAPDGSEAQVRSYTTTLAFEVLQDLPPIPPPPRPQRTRRPWNY